MNGINGFNSINGVNDFTISGSSNPPPPSTLAAQLVDNLQRPARDTRLDGGNDYDENNHSDNYNNSSGDATLPALLADVLSAGSAAFSETTIDTKCQLVDLLLRAAGQTLNRRANPNPFSHQADDHGQTIKILCVIEMAVGLFPGILFHRLDAATRNTPGPASRPVRPLFLSLLPTALVFLVQTSNEDVSAAASRILAVSRRAESKTCIAMPLCAPITRYLQACFRDLTSCLELTLTRPLNDANVHIPSGDLVQREYPSLFSSEVQLKRFRVTWQQAAQIASSILPLVYDSKMVRRSASHACDALSGAERLSHIFQKRAAVHSSALNNQGGWSKLVHFSLHLLECLPKLRNRSYLSRACRLLCHFVQLVMGYKNPPASAAFEHEACTSLVALLFLMYTSETSRELVQGIFDSEFRQHLGSVESLSSTGEYFRTVFNTTCTLVLHLDANVDVASIENLEQNDVKEVLLRAITNHEHQANVQNDDSQPPAKKARIEKVKGDASPGNHQSLLLQRLKDLTPNTHLGQFPRAIESAWKIISTATEPSQIQILAILKECLEPTQQPDQVFIDHSFQLLTMLLVNQARRNGPLLEGLRPQLCAMDSLETLLSLSQNPLHFDLTDSPTGKWCMHALTSKNKDIRLSAGKILKHYIKHRSSYDLERQNKVSALDAIRRLSAEKKTLGDESAIWLLGRVVDGDPGEDEILVVLFRLVEYLGHAHPLVNALAFAELLRISGNSSYRAKKMFEPYWEFLAASLVKDLIKRPSAIQRVCDLLEMSIEELLRTTKIHTIPFLVLTKASPVIKRIAEASSGTLQSSSKDVSSSILIETCISADQLSGLLAKLLMHSGPDPENFIVQSLTAISEDFIRIDVSDLLKSDPVRIAFEIFRESSDGDEKSLTRAKSSLLFLSDQHFARLGSSNRRSSRKADGLSTFFESHCLAILKLMSDIVTEVHCPQTIPERRRCLIGIKQMISIGSDHVSGAVPQICACLRSALASRDLHQEAFSAWSALIQTLTDISNLVNPTFALIAHHFKRLGVSTQRKAQELIAWLFNERQELMRENIVSLPSLAGIPLFAKFEADISKSKEHLDQRRSFLVFSERLASEDPLVIDRALEELGNYLESNQEFLQACSLTERPEPVVAWVIQAVLDACVRLGSQHTTIALNCARCLGMIGCLDPTRIELAREDHDIIVASNFFNRDETIDFIVFFLGEILVKAFMASMSPRSQNFLGYAMQHLLEICDFRPNNNNKGLEDSASSEKWITIPEEIRTVLTPFLTSRYTVLEGNPPAPAKYPIYNVGIRHATWLRELVYDLLRKTKGDNANMIFQICRRIVRGQDISVAGFLLPYVTLNILIGGDLDHQHEIGQEFLSVLIQPVDELSQASQDELMLCSQDVFRTLDYFSRWIHQKKSTMTRMRLPPGEIEESNIAVSTLESLVSSIPVLDMSRRAVECKNFSRGLFYWERYMRQYQTENESTLREDPRSGDFLYERLQEIYVQIDEPDCIDGVSSFLHLLDVDQQVLEHRKARRWSPVQNWSEILLQESPDNTDYQIEYLKSLRESNQYEVLLKSAALLDASNAVSTKARPLMIEASWATSNWEKLVEVVSEAEKTKTEGVVSGIGAAFAALYNGEYDVFEQTLRDIRIEAARGLSRSTTKTLQSCREVLLHMHALTEIEMICKPNSIASEPSESLFVTLKSRFEAIGAFPLDKQHVLTLRRASMLLSKSDFSNIDLSSSWLESAKLFRKQDAMSQAFKCVLHATKLGNPAAAMEYARLLWKEGRHRKAIQSLEDAILDPGFVKDSVTVSFDGNNSYAKYPDGPKSQSIVAARAALLRAKWMDRAGQTQSESIIKLYQEACALYTRWEKGQYSLGRHYNKLLESERMKPPAKQSQPCITGELAKHVIENYLRSMAYGARYVHQTLPRVLTLWCELGTLVDQNLESRYGTDESFRNHVMKHRKMFFDATVSQLKKYIDRLPAFVFYTALNQICARICHANTKVSNGLADIIIKVCVTHPQQALWTLFAMVRSTAKDRMQKGQACIARIQDHARKMKNEGNSAEVKLLIAQGTKITEQLLEVCNADLRKFSKRQNKVNIKDLGFSHKQASSTRLVIPLESTLTVSLPTATDTVDMRRHKAFTKDTITIQSFSDEVLLLSSLVRPRKVDVRGSDGHTYGILCKPKDDLRLDQRLLEFNATIKRLLKKDAESTKRRLYVKTYSVTPLNEECGLIEWVDGLKTHRDILLNIYSRKGITPDYRAIGSLLDEAVKDDLGKFTDVVQGMFPLVFHEWFVEAFPDPEGWYNARLRYTRSCAVMSMVGNVLGLGDRHSENIMIEEGNGGIMHVDFNCLFDKGLTFEKPEKVPFRLTANMVDAFGAYGCEGPFRKACELTMTILRQHEDTLMTVLEQFLYDPTIELMGNRKRRANTDVPSTPEAVLESVRHKVRGLLPKEAVPLSVEGYVEYLIQVARDPFRLASMYIGWCAFL